MEEFNVRVESNEQMRVVSLSDALNEGKRQAALMLARGYKPRQVLVLFFHEVTGVELCEASLIDAETIVFNSFDSRFLSLEGLIAKI